MGDSYEAKLSLGYRHLMGYGVPRSCESSVLYYSQVAEQVVRELVDRPIGAVIERSRLSDERSRSQAPEEDDDVIQYYQHSAEAGDQGAQVALGHLHYYGARGMPHDPVRAARYFQAAASHIDRPAPEALTSLAQMHLQGVGVIGNNDTAFRYFEEAAKLGHAAAYAGLGYMYLHGIGTSKDEAKALSWLKKGMHASLLLVHHAAIPCAISYHIISYFM